MMEKGETLKPLSEMVRLLYDKHSKIFRDRNAMRKCPCYAWSSIESRKLRKGFLIKQGKQTYQVWVSVSPCNFGSSWSSSNSKSRTNQSLFYVHVRSIEYHPSGSRCGNVAWKSSIDCRWKQYTHTSQYRKATKRLSVASSNTP